MQLKDTTMLKKVEELEPTPLAKFLLAISRDDWRRAETLLNDDIEWDMMPNSQIRKGKKEVMPFLKASWTAANNRIPTVINNVATKEWGVMEYWNIGTISEGVIEFAKQSKWPFVRDLPNLIGRTYKVPVCFIYHINQQGKIDLVREYLDVGSMLTQFE
jgi:limonene-1,2-epoxide hydrolase